MAKNNAVNPLSNPAGRPSAGPSTISDWSSSTPKPQGVAGTPPSFPGGSLGAMNNDQPTTLPGPDREVGQEQPTARKGKGFDND